jgi:chromosome segregation ATPase
MIEKIKNILKKFIASIKARNLKDIAIAVLVFSLVIVGWRTYSLWQKGKQLKEDGKEHAQQIAQNKLVIEQLKLLIKKLATDIVGYDKKILELDGKIVKTEEEKKEIEKDFEKFKNDLKKKSQVEQDKDLEKNLKQHNIDVKIVAVKNYMEIVPQERLDLNLFVIDYDKLFTLHQKNEIKLIPDLKEEVKTLKNKTIALQGTIDANTIKCNLEKENLSFDLEDMTKSRNIWKKKAFWSKVGGFFGIILTILLMK